MEEFIELTEHKDTVNKELDLINYCLGEALEYNLVAEVIWSALRILKEHPEISIMDAIDYGYNDWIK